jgi:hypothetical protein
VMSICGWRAVEGGCVVGECSAEMFGEMGEGRLFASLRNWLRASEGDGGGFVPVFSLWCECCERIDRSGREWATMMGAELFLG